MRTAILLSGLLIASALDRVGNIMAHQDLKRPEYVIAFVATTLLAMIVMDVVDFFSKD